MTPLGQDSESLDTPELAGSATSPSVPGRQVDVLEPEMVNETVAYELLLTDLARSAVALVKQHQGRIGASELLDTVSAQHYVMRDDAANAVARLVGTFVELRESAPGDLEFVMADRNE